MSHAGPPQVSAGADTSLADERGMALLVALMAILLVMALGTALILAASVESTITRNFRNSSGALYAADAGVERAVGDLNAIADWNAVLSGAASSAFADGTPTESVTCRMASLSTWPRSSTSPTAGRRASARLQRWMRRLPTVRGARTTRAGSRSRGGH